MGSWGKPLKNLWFIMTRVAGCRKLRRGFGTFVLHIIQSSFRTRWLSSHRIVSLSANPSCDTAVSRHERSSPFGIIQDRLEPSRKLSGKSGKPSFVNQPDSSEIAKMHSVLVAKGGQLHADERFERHEFKAVS